jgi:hypothetical protein
MPEPTVVARSTIPRERKYRRFKLEYPLRLLFRVGEQIAEIDAVSRDVSIGGLLLECPIWIPQGSEVNFVISLRARTFRSVELMGEGRVVRIQKVRAGIAFMIAIECKNPITQMENHLPADC